ncbi:hypothetical protein N7510_010446 [Penicillium lagena]|uniref:uncharacterized protein n=1 Tax=Penicillium lagena TaxID=94218 RepID=UPI00253F82F8|nr:uncharacterized protein N7510_010446 [Penicillium lagena]KAJ5605292.1 hypothetical protein N7510_010446 [Penicillium lagena]
MTGPLDVLIIGAGIAGLSAAIALGKQGHRVVILERSGFLKETGAAIHLPPNCTALLQWLGINPMDFGGTLLHEIHRYGFDGDLKYKKEFAAIRQEWQAEWYLVHRVDLHNNLKQRAIETATLHTQCKITEINIEGTRPWASIEDGRTFVADLVLGADGLHSQVRKSIAPGAPSPYQVGKSCFRWLLPMDRLREHQSTLGYVRDPGVFIEWAAEDRRLVAYPCSNNKVFNLCAFVPSSEENIGSKIDSWQTFGDKETIVRAFSKFSPGVKRIVNSATNNLNVWELYDMNTLPTWVKGNAALLGDAAHPFQPYMGQGGAMAIEDAVSIATLLAAGTCAEDIPARLEMYQSSRRPRVDLVQNFTRLNGRDENDASGNRITPADMVKIMRICFSYNEIEHSTQLLAGQEGS